MNKKFFEDIKTILSFLFLRKNWNGYGANRISLKTIYNALWFRWITKDFDFLLISPVARNSIQFECEDKDIGAYLEFEVFEDHIKVFFSESCESLKTGECSEELLRFDYKSKLLYRLMLGGFKYKLYSFIKEILKLSRE